MIRAVWLTARSARRRVVVTQEVATVGARLHVVAADAVTARCTGDVVRVAVRLVVDSTRMLMRCT